MHVSVETTSTLGRRLKVAVPADRVEKEFSARLQQLSKQVKMPGFRPGKVPLKMVEAQFGGRLMNEVAGELIQTTFREAIGSQGLRPAVDPRVQHKPFGRGEELEYTIEFEIYPEVKRSDLVGERIERPVVEINDPDVDRTLETIRKQRSTWKPVEREAHMGDRVTIDFVGKLNGQEFEGGKAAAFPLVLGGGTLIESLEQGLVGAKAGDERRIRVKFPANYQHALLAGQEAEFDVKTSEVAEPVVPELNEAFAKELGVKDGTIEQLRAEVKANLTREASARVRAVLRARILSSLLEANPIEVPRSLVDTELERLKTAVKSRSLNTADKVLLEKRAYRQVALGLILGEIVRTKAIKPDPTEVRARIEEMAADYESPQEYIQWHYASPERLSEVESLILEGKIVDELLGSVELVDKPMSFQELMKTEAIPR